MSARRLLPLSHHLIMTDTAYSPQTRRTMNRLTSYLATFVTLDDGDERDRLKVKIDLLVDSLANGPDRRDPAVQQLVAMSMTDVRLPKRDVSNMRVRRDNYEDNIEIVRDEPNTRYDSDLKSLKQYSMIYLALLGLIIAAVVVSVITSWDWMWFILVPAIVFFGLGSLFLLFEEEHPLVEWYSTAKKLRENPTKTVSLGYVRDDVVRRFDKNLSTSSLCLESPAVIDLLMDIRELAGAKNIPSDVREDIVRRFGELEAADEPSADEVAVAVYRSRNGLA